MEYFVVLLVTGVFWFFCGVDRSIKNKLTDSILWGMSAVFFLVFTLIVYMLNAMTSDLSNKTDVCKESGGTIYNARCYERGAVQTLLDSEIKLEKIENEK